jgi:hypothetical protein
MKAVVYIVTAEFQTFRPPLPHLAGPNEITDEIQGHDSSCNWPKRQLASRNVPRNIRVLIKSKAHQHCRYCESTNLWHSEVRLYCTSLLSSTNGNCDVQFRFCLQILPEATIVFLSGSMFCRRFQGLRTGDRTPYFRIQNSNVNINTQYCSVIWDGRGM